MDEHTQQLAQEALDLHNHPQSHYIFRNSLDEAIRQVAGEQDIPDLNSLDEIEDYKESLIQEITDAVEELKE